VLEPVGTRPVIIEDDCFIGAGVILTEGIIVESGAVVAPGVFLSASVPIYDTVNKKILKGEIPKNALVISGTRPIQNNPWAHELGLSMSCALIIKYRDEKTSQALMLESALR
jgi:2,3,4,5-tetrahydropyridine-2-carboxylate N-succinyltransferase